jgi:hypothetical protein
VDGREEVVSFEGEAGCDKRFRQYLKKIPLSAHIALSFGDVSGIEI